MIGLSWGISRVWKRAGVSKGRVWCFWLMISSMVIDCVAHIWISKWQKGKPVIGTGAYAERPPPTHSDPHG